VLSLEVRLVFAPSQDFLPSKYHVVG
jgi:hypothetical protein